MQRNSIVRGRQWALGIAICGAIMAASEADIPCYEPLERGMGCTVFPPPAGSNECILQITQDVRVWTKTPTTGPGETTPFMPLETVCTAEIGWKDMNGACHSYPEPKWSIYLEFNYSTQGPPDCNVGSGED